MPTYDYLCEKCGNRFEKFQPITAAPLKKCPACGKKPTRLIGGGAGVVFKGSGFYQTDYRSSQYKEAAGKDAPPAPVQAKKGCGPQACKSPDDCSPSPKKK